MNSKIILHKLTIIATITMLGIVGCGRGDKVSNTNEDASEKMSVAVEVSAEESESEEIQSETVAEPVIYEYEQDLNIIDDNYRNYYEIFVYSFYDSDGDGIGDLNGVTEKLDYVGCN